MKRSKKLFVLLGILAILCAATFAAQGIQEQKEQIRETGEVLLELPTEQIEAIAWSQGEGKLSFHREDGVWKYDDDEAFPVDAAVMEDMLSIFRSFAVTFAIEHVEDLGLYGLEDPVSTVELSTAETSYTLAMGDFSKMDSQRYITLSDGNVYLVVTDPLETFDAVLSDLIDHDEIPVWDTVQTVTFNGAHGYAIEYSTDIGSYCADDVYFWNGKPLDSEKVRNYLDDLSDMNLTDYVTYNASKEDLKRYALAEPALTITVDDFTLHVGLVKEDETTAYARVGESPIVYQLSASDQNSLLAYTYDDLRHQKLFTADFDTVTAMDITLEGVTHSLILEGGTWKLADAEIEADDICSGVTGLTADSFTAQEPTGQEEIRLMLHLTNDHADTMEIALYRQDGSLCLCQVGGESVALVSRSAVVELVEAVHAIVLN